MSAGPLTKAQQTVLGFLSQPGGAGGRASVRQLHRSTGLSRSTVEIALKVLNDQGLVSTLQGTRTVASQHIVLQNPCRALATHYPLASSVYREPVHKQKPRPLGRPRSQPVSTEAYPQSHDHIRRLAVKWLTEVRRCRVVLSEIRSACSEVPDAIGWDWEGNSSFMVEAKASKEDFHANKNKPHSRPGCGVGRYRYFMTPSGLIRPEELDIALVGTTDSDYGLLWVEENQVQVIKEAALREQYDRAGEMAMLISALRRVRTREFLTILEGGSL
jgi:DNA-binding transcriptional ArsR family regulator